MIYLVAGPHPDLSLYCSQSLGGGAVLKDVEEGVGHRFEFFNLTDIFKVNHSALAPVTGK